MLMLKPLPLPRPKPFPLPKIRRLPRSTRLTIAAGFICTDGIVICADTQETIPGYVKTHTQKMKLMRSPFFNIAFTGAGDGELIDMTVQEMDIALAREKPTTEWDIRQTLKKSLLDTFHAQILCDPDILPEHRPDLLIALQYDAGTLLYKATGTKIFRLESSVCVGSGLLMAKSLIAQLFDPGMNLAQGSLVAMHVLNQAKRWVDGCGGNSDVLMLSNQGRTIVRVPTDEVKTMEAHFDEFNNCIRPLFLAAPDGKVTHEQFEELVKKFRIDMLTIRGRFMEFEEFYRRLCDLHGVALPDVTPEPLVTDSSQSPKP
jgi:hypothetical protein